MKFIILVASLAYGLFVVNIGFAQNEVPSMGVAGLAIQGTRSHSPVSLNDNETGKAKNRRVELVADKRILWFCWRMTRLSKLYSARMSLFLLRL